MRTRTFPIFARTFINRSLERALLWERWQSALESHGSLLLVKGDAGVGKSRLLSEFCRDVGEDGGFVLRSGCLPYATAPFAPIAEVVHTAIEAHQSAAPPAPYLRTVLRTIVPDIRPPFEIISSDSSLVRRWMLDAIAETFGRLSATRPVVVVIEDIHWADADTLAAMAYLASKIESLRIVLIGAYRDERATAPVHLNDFVMSATRLRITTTIALSELGEKDARALALAAIPAGERLPALEIDRICRSSSGNALFIEELIKHAFDSRGTPGPLPESIESLLRERLAGFSKEDLRVLGLAGALIGAFDAGEIAVAAKLDAVEVSATLKRANQHNILVESGDVPARYDFRHHLMRTAMYGMLDRSEATVAHRTFAERLEGIGGIPEFEALAYHWYHAGDRERALRYGMKSGDAAMAAYAYERAISVYTSVRPFAHDERTAAELDFRIARMHKNIGSGREAVAYAESAARGYEALGDRDELARTRLSLSSMRAREWSELSLADAECALEAVGGDAGNRWGFAARLRLAETCFLHGKIEEARSHVAAAAPHLKSAAGTHVSLYHQVCSWLAFHEGDPRSVALALAAVESARRENDIENLPGIAANAGAVALERGDRASAAAQFAVAIEAAERYRLTGIGTYAKIAYAGFLCEYGSLNDARAIVDECMSAPVESRWLISSLAAVALRIGLATSDAELVATWSSPDHLDFSRQSGEGARFGPHAAACAELAWRRGNLDQARNVLREAVAMMPDAHGNHATLVLVAAIGLADELPAARTILQSTASRWRVERSRAYLHLYDALASSPGAQRAQEARSAIAGFEHLGISIPAGLAYEIVDDLENARRHYGHAGAKYDLDRLAQRAASTKSRLSKRENEIAAMLAGGLTNKEIALTLALSDRTVENHVAAILRKLELRSRTEVAARIVAEARNAV